MKTPLFSRPFLLPAAVAAALSFAAVWAASARPTASTSAGPAYQYAGLDRSLARVDPATGRIWVLRFHGSGQLSLLAAPAEPGWAWHEIRVESAEPIAPSPASGR